MKLVEKMGVLPVLADGKGDARMFEGVGQIPFLSKKEIVGRVEELLDECWDGSFPINVEAICDYLGVSIVPVRRLVQEFQVDAYVSADFKTIYVEQEEYEKESYRYRFSVAHELGHLVLHREYFSSRVDGFEEWQGLTLGSKNYYTEFQANYFAGSLLMPEREMTRVLNLAFGGSLARNYFNVSLGELSRIMAKVRGHFKVSKAVMSRRMREEIPGMQG